MLRTVKQEESRVSHILTPPADPVLLCSPGNSAGTQTPALTCSFQSPSQAALLRNVHIKPMIGRKGPSGCVGVEGRGSSAVTRGHGGYVVTLRTVHTLKSLSAELSNKHLRMYQCHTSCLYGRPGYKYTVRCLSSGELRFQFFQMVPILKMYGEGLLYAKYACH